MTLRRRLDRLEAQHGKFPNLGSIAVLRPVVVPSAAGPVVVGAMARRAGETWRHLTREPGEALGAFMARARGTAERAPMVAQSEGRAARGEFSFLTQRPRYGSKADLSRPVAVTPAEENPKAPPRHAAPREALGIGTG